MAEIRVHQGDLPNLDNYKTDAIAIDTETLGLQPHRDRLCVVQISSGDGTADIIQIAKGQKVLLIWSSFLKITPSQKYSILGVLILLF